MHSLPRCDDSHPSTAYRAESYLVHPIRVEPRLVVDEEHPAAARQRVPLHRQLLHTAGEQEEKRPWSIWWPSGELACRPRRRPALGHQAADGDLACRPRTDAQRIAYRQAAYRHGNLAPSPLSNCRPQQRQDLACRPGTDAQRIAHRYRWHAVWPPRRRLHGNSQPLLQPVFLLLAFRTQENASLQGLRIGVLW